MDTVLFEAQLWCAFCSAENESYSLRTERLRPAQHLYEVFAGLSTHDENFKQDYIRRLEGLKQITEYVIQKRSQLIMRTVLDKREQRSFAGKLLQYEPFISTGDGLSRAHSKGICDEFDEPGWDGWVRYVVCTDELQRWQAGARDIGRVDFLLCWIPQHLVDRVDEAIDFNADLSLEWHTGSSMGE